MMPYKEGKRWRGVVRFTPTHGPIIRRTKFFETKKQAGDWEGETVKALKVADQRNPAKADVIGRALTVMEWANRYLDHLEATMCRKTYNEKRSAFQRLGGGIRDDRSLVGRISLHVALEHLVGTSERHPSPGGPSGHRKRCDHHGSRLPFAGPPCDRFSPDRGWRLAPSRYGITKAGPGNRPAVVP
jgi:hypothetical protein